MQNVILQSAVDFHFPRLSKFYSDTEKRTVDTR